MRRVVETVTIKILRESLLTSGQEKLDLLFKLETTCHGWNLFQVNHLLLIWISIVTSLPLIREFIYTKNVRFMNPQTQKLQNLHLYFVLLAKSTQPCLKSNAKKTCKWHSHYSKLTLLFFDWGCSASLCLKRHQQFKKQTCDVPRDCVLLRLMADT